MIYIETASDDVYYNFGLEYYFTVEKKLHDTVFLFWRTTPTLMVGKYQNILEEIDKNYADTHGINIVRRMSGGGTIYTDLGGWQFTFIPHKTTENIEFIPYIRPVIDALGALGVEASFTGRNDLVIAGRKFSGNAQYCLSGYTVHHGSLLYDTDIEQMVKSTTVDSYKITSKSIKSVRDRVTNISEHLINKLSPEEFKIHMVKYIMGKDYDIYELSEEDNRRIKELAEERFSSWQAIYGANPKFNIEKTGRFAGGKMSFKLDVHAGIIKDAHVYGDFFSVLSPEQICQAIIGVRYSKDDVLESLRSHGIEGAVYNISVQDIAELIAG